VTFVTSFDLRQLPGVVEAFVLLSRIRADAIELLNTYNQSKGLYREEYQWRAPSSPTKKGLSSQVSEYPQADMATGLRLRLLNRLPKNLTRMKVEMKMGVVALMPVEADL
jgi:hypothetical protein